MPQPYTTVSFAEELRRLIDERGLTLRGLASEVGGFDQAYLSRMLHGQRAVNANHAARIAQHLGLPEDYFAEVREARLIDAIRRDPVLRDELYFARVASRSA